MTPLAIETQLAQAGCRRDPHTGALSVPIYQTSAFAHEALGHSTGFDYSRTSNPTRLALEETLAAVEGGHRGFAFASGLAAIDAVLRLLPAGSRVVATADLYGGTFRLFEQTARAYGIEALYVDTSDTEATRRALREPGVRALFVESLTNPLLKVADLPALLEAAREGGATTIVDNTFLTPCLLRPLDLDADLIVYSATKYLAGHNDVVAGAVITRTPAWSERLAFQQNAVGAVLGPQDAWLVLRGLKTLPLRLRQQGENARRLAEWLAQHPRVKRVHYPGLPGHPGHATLARQAAGFGAMIAFEVADAGRVPAILKGVRVFLFAESLGGVESLITLPREQTHADLPADTLDRLGIGPGLLRLSIGIEDVNDLIRDLENVL
ncbi:MAG: PLP-dependent transferase [Lentisphaerae bacterium]|nr:PLP-dependent transferase [Lentisphaerota bacterium]